MRSSFDTQFPGQGYDVRAAVRYLRENADAYGIDADRIAFMGNSSGGWSAAFAATTSDTLQLPGETGVDGTSSAVQVAVPFFPPTDFLSMDDFAMANGLPMAPGIYPHDAPGSPESRLILCPGETPATPRSIQDCPEQTEAADPSTYIDGAEVPVWVLHGLADPLLPFNQSQLVYETTTAEGNEARFTLVPGGRALGRRHHRRGDLDHLRHQPRRPRDGHRGPRPDVGRHRAVPAPEPEPGAGRQPLTSGGLCARGWPRAHRLPRGVGHAGDATARDADEVHTLWSRPPRLAW